MTEHRWAAAVTPPTQRLLKTQSAFLLPKASSQRKVYTLFNICEQYGQKSLAHVPLLRLAVGHRSTHGIWLARSPNLRPPALQRPSPAPAADAAANPRSLVAGAVP